MDITLKTQRSDTMKKLDEQQVWNGLSHNQKRGVLTLKENFQVIDGIPYSADGKDLSHLIDINLKTSQAQYEGLKVVESVGDHEKENGGFVFAFFNACKTMEDRFPTLTQADLARVMFIGTYAAWRTGRLQHGNGVAMNKKALGELIGLSRAKFNIFYKSLVECEIITEQGKDIFVNPALFYYGFQDEIKHLSKDMQYTRLFRQTVRDLYELYTGKALKQLALVYSVLPFVNFQFNVLAYNPEEMYADQVRPITIDKLAALLGYKDSPNLAAALRKLKYDGKSVFGMFELDDKRYKKIVINPRVVYAGDGRHLEAIKVLFK
jgi:hypothetical protein